MNTCPRCGEVISWEQSNLDKEKEIEVLKIQISQLQTQLENYQHIDNVRRGYSFDDSEQ